MFYQSTTKTHPCFPWSPNNARTLFVNSRIIVYSCTHGMPDRERTVRVLALCTAWYAISSTQNVINKKFLSAHSLPVTLSLVHMLSIALYLPIVIGILVVPASPVFSSMYYLRVLMPLSLGKLLASVTAHVSIWKVPVSYAHTGTTVLLL